MPRMPKTYVIFKILLCFLCLIFLNACSSHNHKSIPIKTLQRSDDYHHKLTQVSFKPIDLTKKIRDKRLVQKTKYLLFLIDESKAMTQSYKGKTKKQYLKQSLQDFQNSIPKELNFIQEILLFGNPAKPNIHTLDSISVALQAADKKLKNNPNNISLLILSEWKILDGKTRSLVNQLLVNYPELCIHMIGIGNIHNNHHFFGYCGHMVSANQLKQPEKMADFVENIFFSGPSDSDEDGVYDYLDSCPNTPIDTPISWNGCARNSERSNPRYVINNHK